MNKIIIIGPFPPPINGCSFANKILYENLIRQNIDCVVIDTSANKHISSKQGTSFSFKKAFDFGKIYSKIFSIKRGIQVVYFTPGQTFFGLLKYAPFMLVCILKNIPYIIHVHGNYLGKEYRLLIGIKKKIFGYLISNAAAGIVLSDSLKANLTDLLPLKDIYVVENFVENTLFQNNIQKNKDKLRILYLSNLMEEKGILQLLGACEKIKSEGINFELKLAGNIESSIEQQVKKVIGKIPEINYVGVVSGDAKKQLFLDANIFALPTYYTMEGQPISLLEGMATGNIILTTNHAGITDIVHPENGVFVEKKSVESIAESLRNIYGNLDMVDNISRTNIKYCLKNFTEAIFTQKIINIFNEVSKPK
jgi:glycosyltransferase involved in cell wall biosynthesis